MRYQLTEHTDRTPTVHSWEVRLQELCEGHVGCSHSVKVGRREVKRAAVGPRGRTLAARRVEQKRRVVWCTGVTLMQQQKKKGASRGAFNSWGVDQR
jgi:hypothetical protein